MMVIFLRDKNNRDIWEIEIYEKNGSVDISTAIYLKEYSLKLFTIGIGKLIEFVDDMTYLTELRGIFFESCDENFKRARNDYSFAIEYIREIVKRIGKKYDLRVVED